MHARKCSLAATWVLIALGCSSAKAPTVRRDGGSGVDVESAVEAGAPDVATNTDSGTERDAMVGEDAAVAADAGCDVDGGASCDDGNPCTRDVCAGSAGCQRTNLDGQLCGSERWCFQGACGGRFADTGGGTVVDFRTGLEWQRVGWSADYGTTGDRPQHQCNGCNTRQETSTLPGRGWVVPTGAQLNALREGSTCQPALFTWSGAPSFEQYTADSTSSCTPPHLLYWQCDGRVCDDDTDTAANCRCVRPWAP